MLHAHFTSRIYASEQGYRVAYANKYDRTTLFYVKRATAVTSPGRTMRETASRNTSGYALGSNEEKSPSPEEIPLFTLRGSGSLGNKTYTNNRS